MDACGPRRIEHQSPVRVKNAIIWPREMRRFVVRVRRRSSWREGFRGNFRRRGAREREPFPLVSFHSVCVRPLWRWVEFLEEGEIGAVRRAAGPGSFTRNRCRSHHQVAAGFAREHWGHMKMGLWQEKWYSAGGFGGGRHDVFLTATRLSRCRVFFVSITEKSCGATNAQDRCDSDGYQ